MAAGDINDPLSQIPGIALADDSTEPTDLGDGYALLKLKSGQLIWLPHDGALTYALDTLTPGQVHGITEKAAPVGADELLIEDSAASWAKKRATLTALLGGAGAAIGDPVDWSGTLTLAQSGPVSHTVERAVYVHLGPLIFIQVNITITGSGSTNNAIAIGGIPVAAQPASPYPADKNRLGWFNFHDATGNFFEGALVTNNASDAFIFLQNNGTAAFGQSPNFAVANGDGLSFSGLYVHA